MKILLFILFLYLETSAQNNFIEKEKDSIFLFFDQNAEIKDLKLSSYSGKFAKMYQFTYPDGQQVDFEEFLKGKFSKENFCKRKSYLKKIAKRIITFEDFKKLGRNGIIELF